ncbi:MAG: glutathione S-transferase [Alphaproteobacteria bacterium PA3]|nr:MAG: glutathione S-transferase [Alphaproteobacteria bacterium PA3]
MIDVYAFSTPNSLKVPVALEEMELEYKLHSVNIRQGGQKTPNFMALNPNAKVPVLVDSEAEGGPLTLSESAAILVYLAEKTGKLLPNSVHGRARVMEQLFFHASGIGPAFGNSGFFQKFAPEPIPLAIDRFKSEGRRTSALLDDILSRQEFVAGDEFSIADVAHFGWMWRRSFAGIETEDLVNLNRWYDALAARPAFQIAIARTMALAEVS